MRPAFEQVLLVMNTIRCTCTVCTYVQSYISTLPAMRLSTSVPRQKPVSTVYLLCSHLVSDVRSTSPLASICCRLYP